MAPAVGTLGPPAGPPPAPVEKAEAEGAQSLGLGDAFFAHGHYVASALAGDTEAIAKSRPTAARRRVQAPGKEEP